MNKSDLKDIATTIAHALGLAAIVIGGVYFVYTYYDLGQASAEYDHKQLERSQKAQTSAD